MTEQAVNNWEKTKKRRSLILQWVLINVGTILLAAGVYFFKAPNNFATGGVSGLSIVLSKFITPAVPFLGQTEIMTAINILLLIIGFIFVGKGCTFRTAYCTVVYSLEMELMKLMCPPDKLPLTATAAMPEGQMMLEFVIAMLLTGVASAILFNCKASSGGTDIVALIVKKYTKIKDMGAALFASDVIIASSAFFIFDIRTGLFSILGLFAKAFIVDGVIENIGKNKRLMIITPNPTVIRPYIIETMHRDYTCFKAKGGFTDEDKTVIITVCKRNEAFRLKNKVHELDPAAFVIITDTTEILGKGF